MSKKQEVIRISDTSSKLVFMSLEKLIEDGYHIDQVVQLDKTTFLIVVSKEA